MVSGNRVEGREMRESCREEETKRERKRRKVAWEEGTKRKGMENLTLPLPNPLSHLMHLQLPPSLRRWRKWCVYMEKEQRNMIKSDDRIDGSTYIFVLLCVLSECVFTSVAFIVELFDTLRVC